MTIVTPSQPISQINKQFRFSTDADFWRKVHPMSALFLLPLPRRRFGSVQIETLRVSWAALLNHSPIYHPITPFCLLSYFFPPSHRSGGLTGYSAISQWKIIERKICSFGQMRNSVVHHTTSSSTIIAMMKSSQKKFLFLNTELNIGAGWMNLRRRRTKTFSTAEFFCSRSTNSAFISM